MASLARVLSLRLLYAAPDPKTIQMPSLPPSLPPPFVRHYMALPGLVAAARDTGDAMAALLYHALPRSRPRARCGRRGRCRRGIRSGADGRASVLPTRLHSACHLFPHSLNSDSLLAVALTLGHT